jgi:hypothetical protein
MLKWLRQVIGAGAVSQPDAARLDKNATAIAGPPPGRKWIYIAATDCDVASVVRSIEGVLKVTRESGYWRIVADKDVATQAAKAIAAKGGALSTLITSEALAELHARSANPRPDMALQRGFRTRPGRQHLPGRTSCTDPPASVGATDVAQIITP